MDADWFCVWWTPTQVRFLPFMARPTELSNRRDWSSRAEGATFVSSAELGLCSLT